MPFVRTFKRIGYPRGILKELAWQLRDVTDIPEGFSRDRIRCPDDVFRAFRFLFDNQPRERFVVIVLNATNAPQAIDIITEGLLNASLVHPREVFRAAILGVGAALIVAHNHPSGNPDPSQEDLNITRQLVDGGRLLGIPIQDHIIFAGDKFASLAERGNL
jgi:DNA repair protein RadC